MVVNEGLRHTMYTVISLFVSLGISSRLNDFTRKGVCVCVWGWGWGGVTSYIVVYRDVRKT